MSGKEGVDERPKGTPRFDLGALSDEDTRAESAGIGQESAKKRGLADASFARDGDGSAESLE